jgi:hypothetical protein
MDIFDAVQRYIAQIKLLGDDLQKLGGVLQHFANGLKSSETTTTEKKKGGSDRSPRKLSTSGRTLPILRRGSRPDLIEKPLSRASAPVVAAIDIPTLLLKASKQPPVETLPSPEEPESPRIGEMSPNRFEETGKLCLVAHRVFKDVAVIMECAISAKLQKETKREGDEEYLL